MQCRDATGADRSLVERDGGVTALSLLLDHSRLAAWVSDRLQRAVELDCRYLRYKPGSSCVLAGRMTTDDGTADVVFAGYSAASVAKASKALEQAPPHAVVAKDAGLRLLVTTASADRHVPVLAQLAEPEQRDSVVGRLLERDSSHRLDEVVLDTLSYKPQRRWVGRLTHADRRYVLRAYPPHRMAEAIRMTELLNGTSVPTARLLGKRRRWGIALLEYVEGRAVDAQPDDDILRATGRALAELHMHPIDVLWTRAVDEVAAMRRSNALTATLLPSLAGRLSDLERRVTERIRLAGPSTRAETLHGDFSLDQVVARPDGSATLIDLDRARTGPAADDFATLSAATLVHQPALPPTWLRHVEEGYAELRALPDPSDITIRTAAQLLRRASEPFRTCRPDWAAEIRRLVEASDAALDSVAVPAEVRSAR